MPLWNYRGGREESTFNAETYKLKIKEFLQTKGYVQYANSALEGCLSDLIFKNPNLDGEKETHIEAKWDNFSINDREIRQEFTKYLLLYCRAPIQLRFNLQIFVRKIINFKVHKDLFEEYKQNSIQSLKSKIASELTGEDATFFSSISQELFTTFLYSVLLIQADILDLELKIDQTTGRNPGHNDPYVIYQNINEETGVLNHQEILFSNLFEIKKFERVWKARTDYSFADEIIRVVQNPPPFTFYGDHLICLIPFDERNCLTPLIYQESIQEIRVRDWSSNEDTRRILINLLNRAGQRICELRGLKKKRSEVILNIDVENTQRRRPKRNFYIYYFPNPNHEETKKMNWDKYEPNEGHIQKRTCKRRIWKKYAEMSPNPYFLHIAVNLEATYFDGIFYFLILPAKVFSTDGVREVNGERAKYLDRKFRNPKFSRNRCLLLEALFWGSFLFPYLTVVNQTLISFISSTNTNSKSVQLQKILETLSVEYFKLLRIDKTPILPTGNSNTIIASNSEEDDSDELESIFETEN